MRLRGPIAALACLLALLLTAPGAPGAPRTPLQDQIADLSGGIAILQYDRALQKRRLAARRTRFLRAVRASGADVLAFRRLPMVAVRGSRLELRRAARVRGVTAAHMNEELRYYLHESVPLVYGGEHTSTWSSGLDGRGGSVAVVDSGVDGTHADLRNRVVRNVKVLDPGELFEGDRRYFECPTACNTDTTSGHGTHVAGTTSGDGSASDGFYTGMAPGSGVVGLGTGEVIVILNALAAFDYILQHHRELNIVTVNNSWGPASTSGRYDSRHPINQGSKALHDAGMTVVFAAGNSGPGEEENPEGASDCSTVPDDDGDGDREPSDGACMFNVYAAAPWVVSVAAGRKDGEGGPGDQKLAFFSSRGDPQQELSIDGQPTLYQPTLTAPGVNVRAARDPNGVLTASCGASAEPPSCVPPRPEYEPFYLSSSGTSMAAPHVAGGVAVLQSAAQQQLGRRLTPDETKQVLAGSAAPMTGNDAFWDWPCSEPFFRECGFEITGTTGGPYEAWQVGSGYLDMRAALARVSQLPAAGAGGGQTPPAGSGGDQGGGTTGDGGGGGTGGDQGGNQGSPSQPGSGERESAPRRAARRRAALRRCLRRANRRADTRKERRAARRRCRARYSR